MVKKYFHSSGKEMEARLKPQKISSCKNGENPDEMLQSTQLELDSNAWPHWSCIRACGHAFLKYVCQAVYTDYPSGKIGLSIATPTA